MEYQVTLLGHDWIIANRHILIPSVYTAIEVHKDGLRKPMVVEYPGSTYITIRFRKHLSSNALDFNKLLDLNEIRDFSQNNPFDKPALILSVDSCPDSSLLKGSLYSLYLLSICYGLGYKCILHLNAYHFLMSTIF